MFSGDMQRDQCHEMSQELFNLQLLILLHVTEDSFYN